MHPLDSEGAELRFGRVFEIPDVEDAHWTDEHVETEEI